MAIDIAAIRRRYKHERLVSPFAWRDSAHLVAASDAIGSKRVLVDTTVYLHEPAGRLPPAAETLSDGALRFHSAVCIAEVVFGLSHLHPDSPRAAPAWAYYERLFGSVPGNRVLTADADVLVQAAMVSGILARTQSFAPNQRKALFQDSVIYLTAARFGIPVLTANRGDFDLIQQVAGQGAFIYDTAIERERGAVT